MVKEAAETAAFAQPPVKVVILGLITISRLQFLFCAATCHWAVCQLEQVTPVSNLDIAMGPVMMWWGKVYNTICPEVVGAIISVLSVGFGVKPVIGPRKY